MQRSSPPIKYRRRRVIWITLLLSAASLFYLFTQTGLTLWSLPASLKDLGYLPSSSRAGVVGKAKSDEASRRIRVQEIHGLLHFVTAHPDRSLDRDEDRDGGIDVRGMGWVKVDPENEVDLRVYSPDGDDNWAQHLSVLSEKYPLIMFSKTYCPYSKRAKALLDSYDIAPAPKIIEVDMRSDGPLLQTILNRLTGRRTVPNIILKGDSIGGFDDIQRMHEGGKLKTLLEEGGLTVQAV